MRMMGTEQGLDGKLCRNLSIVSHAPVGHKPPRQNKPIVGVQVCMFFTCQGTEGMAFGYAFYLVIPLTFLIMQLMIMIKSIQHIRGILKHNLIVLWVFNFHVHGIHNQLSSFSVTKMISALCFYFLNCGIIIYSLTTFKYTIQWH